jgi:uroporphyrin-III C-methyltransferase/precorrin-2 dehydrogenase/sirohydrochlorin ferrochelatase
MRKARAFAAAGARVRVVAPEIGAELADSSERLEIAQREFTDADLEAADLVVVATSDPVVNAHVTQLARSKGRLVNRADEPAAGTFDTLAVHRSGDLVIGVSAGGVPRAAAAIRDEIARRFDGRYARALAKLHHERARLLDADARKDWARQSANLLTDDFCTAVESGTLEREIGECR